MSKAVLLSVQPKWCELIASGKKTVEVRKTKPKLDTPFKVYIYCTKDNFKSIFQAKPYLMHNRLHCNGKVIGEFVCNCITSFKAMGEVQALWNETQNTCLSHDEIIKYAKGKKLYYWHISNLVIYDKPKELSEFYVVDYEAVNQCEYRERIYNNPNFTNNALLPGSYVCNKGEVNWCNKCKTKLLSRPPQSWRYVEELSE